MAYSKPKGILLSERNLFPRKKISLPRLKTFLQDKTVLITGASYGIGEATARLLATHGVTLILTARTKEKLELLQNELENQGATVYTFPADLYDIQQTEQLLAFICQSGLKIDVFISNAGKSICRPVEESLDRFHDVTRTMSLNYYTPVRLMLGLIPLLKQAKGQVIHISAINVLFPPAPYWAAYQASKTAIDQWFRTVASELKYAHIRITSVYLPLVQTRMIEPTRAYRNMPVMSAEQAAIVIAHCLIKRKKIFKPWWCTISQCFSFVFRSQWEYFSGRFIKKK
ncbi:MAG: SDR family NAD(P)-dependent oxidoreductase [Tannerella sp.]|nr:SDR family NAD(P)-dependent oxidoreductase [Tannerella sp.]